MNQNEIPLSAQYQRYQSLMRLITKHERLYDNWGTNKGVNFSSFMVLERLLRVPEGESPSELADRYYIPRQTMTYILKGLEKDGYIEHDFPDDDGRRKIIRLSEAGKGYALSLQHALNQEQMRAYALLSEREQKQLNYLMERLTDGLEEEFNK